MIPQHGQNYNHYRNSRLQLSQGGLSRRNFSNTQNSNFSPIPVFSSTYKRTQSPKMRRMMENPKQSYRFQNPRIEDPSINGANRPRNNQGRTRNSFFNSIQSLRYQRPGETDYRSKGSGGMCQGCFGRPEDGSSTNSLWFC